MTTIPEKHALDRTTTSQSSNDIGGDPYIRRMGRLFIIALHGATRAIKLYPVENEAVKKALDDLTAVTTEILTREGEFELRVTSEFIFINQTRLRLDLDNYASFSHVLSVFPGSATWDQPATVLSVPAPTHVEPHVDRVTLHPRLLAAARRVVVLTSGAGKADVVARAWDGADPRELPLAAARLPNAVWILDETAAARLPRS